MTGTLTDLNAQTATESLQRIAADISMITDKKLVIDAPSVDCAHKRPAGQHQIHISFKLGFQRGREISHGTFLLPLTESISLAGWLMMLTDDVVTAKRGQTTLDSGTKDALLEIGNFVAGACEAALRSIGTADVKVRSEGCQGVRANVRPALNYEEGSELVVAFAKARLENGAPFDVILVLPPFAPAAL
jgi:hypothetical protein